jgi:hypothetical protein
MLEDLDGAMHAYGRVLRSEVAGDPGHAEGELRQRLASAQRHRDRMAEILLRMPADDPAVWSLRGELLVHLDRLLDQLRVEHRARAREGWPHRRRGRRTHRPDTARRPGLGRMRQRHRDAV